jgi:hypothetical protein
MAPQGTARLEAGNQRLGDLTNAHALLAEPVEAWRQDPYSVMGG